MNGLNTSVYICQDFIPEYARRYGFEYEWVEYKCLYLLGFYP